jgi:hypothetical protein
MVRVPPLRHYPPILREANAIRDNQPAIPVRIRLNRLPCATGGRRRVGAIGGGKKMRDKVCWCVLWDGYLQ